MSICSAGMNLPVLPGSILINISGSHPLIQLAKMIPWTQFETIVMPDLKQSTPKDQWWLGRKLKLRVHLAVYILQQLYNKTDRQIEYDVKDNAAFRLFCGCNIVKNWHAPDHTKIETFRSRLSPQTQQRLANELAVLAVKLGFANPAKLDVDSTVQEANITHPADTKLITKIGALTHRIAVFLNKRQTQYWSALFKTGQIKRFKHSVNLGLIRKKLRSFTFIARYASPNHPLDFQEMIHRKAVLWFTILKESLPVWVYLKALPTEANKALPWYIQSSINKLAKRSGAIMLDSIRYICFGIVPKRLYSLHLEEIACFNKRKLNKKYEFGRAFQLGRIGGNFFFVAESTDVRMSDRKSLPVVIKTHQTLFGKKALESFATDRGYYTNDNYAMLEEANLREFRLPKPGVTKVLTALSAIEGTVEDKAIIDAKIETERIQQKLSCRESGIEPLIGHLKHGWQMGKSRMKSDKTILASGYSAVLGFNLRQLIRHNLINNLATEGDI